MAPVAQGDIEMDSHTSDMASQDSPLRRQFSEPLHGHSASTQASPPPSPMTHKSKCGWCGQYFESVDNDPVSHTDALKAHIASAHSQIARESTYNEAVNGDQSYDTDELLDAGDDEDNAALDDQTGDVEAAEAEAEDEEEEAVEATENGLVEGVEPPETYENENDQNDIDEEEADAEGDGEGHEGESDLALSNQLHEFSREQDSVTLEKRLHNLWNIHDVRKFSADYDDKYAGLEKTWEHVFDDAKRSKKRDSFDSFARPEPYTKSKVARGEFLEMTPLEDLLAQLRDAETRAPDELYAITENVAYVLKAWQDEYLAIEKLHKVATRHNVKQTSGPRKLDRREVFEDKKEAMLYGYKHDPKEDKVGNQNPFVQGGFKPTPAQARKIIAKSSPSMPNPDGWPTVSKFGVEHVPKFQNPPREDFVGKATRKRKAAEMEAAKANETDEAPAESPALADADADNAGRRRTRTRRSAAEAEFQPPAPMRGSGRGRGRGRGRGGARMGSRAGSETPQSEFAASPARASGRTGREGTAPTSGLLQARTATSQLAPLEPAPSGAQARVSPVATISAAEGSLDSAMDPAEQARREKIANSKNPKRTEAMLNHWARFNREGRTRNPKRSKAQIEADRAAEAARKAIEPPKIVGKKKRLSSPTFGDSPNTDLGLAPAPTIPPPASLAPGPSGPHPQLAPMPAPRGSMAPYAPIDPRSVAPFPPAPPGPLQPPPPQPYHTPYPDFYNFYGAPAPGLPHAGRARPT
ncbi:hypothetical protein P170DRAFT_34573 [Aspergillus steynii IBT 23096]|uniref:Uncharacterized protein n=1 Tax=Aspergillus steynii IBT 23096 TaxID=1392250 RepID=A0A2I2GQK0_9EURO|nr:uncharacterized protein P170DRAFT_34573 [Aspergillus steynii IBT 23096]PLB55157.1 hypothetical protein P170DRAFT_34573 [Aspergillus steynii IBT 23096]